LIVAIKKTSAYPFGAVEGYARASNLVNKSWSKP
jgi:hypothetical protein